MTLSPLSVRLARFVLVTFFGIGLALSAIASNITYEYTNGRLTKLIYADGTIVDYSYDANVNRTAAAVTLPVDSTPPTVPGNVVATATSQTVIQLAWSASTDNVGVAGYEVQRCSGANCSSFSTISTSATTPFLDSGLSQNTTYRYRVRAYDAANNFSSYSAIAGST